MGANIMENSVIYLCNNVKTYLNDVLKFSDSQKWLVKNAMCTLDGISIIPFKAEKEIFILFVNIYKTKNKLILHLQSDEIRQNSMNSYSEKKTFEIFRDNKEFVIDCINEELV